MQLRKLGRSALMVSPICFGGNVFGWTINERESFKILDAFISSGFNFVDTADVYSRWASGIGGESETIIGNWMKVRKNRNRIMLATKVGNDMGGGKKGLSKKYILKAVEDSLKRLQTDHIDLYQSHRDDEVTPVEDTLQAYQELIKQGKVRYIGASNFSPSRLRDSLNAASRYELPRYECLQPHYNLCERHLFEGELQQICSNEDLGVIPYYSLAAGFLAGKYRNEADLEKSVRGKGVKKYLNDRGTRILNALDAVSAAHKCEPSSVALAWLLSQPSVTAPLASATNETQLTAILKATEIKLTPDEIKQLNAASA
jgi:aryl-alcohol dehydrogenase-like predicted oxidoreductase